MYGKQSEFKKKIKCGITANSLSSGIEKTHNSHIKEILNNALAEMEDEME